jgi:hypothetical protein
MKHGMKKDKRMNYMMGSKVEKVDGIMDGNKAARRGMKGGGMRYGYGHGGKVMSGAMKKAKPC